MSQNTGRPQCVVCGFQGPARTAATCPNCRNVWVCGFEGPKHQAHNCQACKKGKAPTRAVETIDDAVETAREFALANRDRVIIIRPSEGKEPKFQVSAMQPWQMQFISLLHNVNAGDCVLLLLRNGGEMDHRISGLLGNEYDLRRALTKFCRVGRVNTEVMDNAYYDPEAEEMVIHLTDLEVEPSHHEPHSARAPGLLGQTVHGVCDKPLNGWVRPFGNG